MIEWVKNLIYGLQLQPYFYTRQVKLLNIESIEDNYAKELKITFQMDGETYQAIGSCTVWNYFPSGNRCDSMLENEMFFGSCRTGVEASQFLQDFASKMLKAAKALKKE